MTWKEIFETKNYEEYLAKAEKQRFVYVLYSTNPPYLPIDICYSLYEVAVKYPQPINSVYRQYYQAQKCIKYGYTIESVFT